MTPEKLKQAEELKNKIEDLEKQLRLFTESSPDSIELTFIRKSYITTSLLWKNYTCRVKGKNNELQPRLKQRITEILNATNNAIRRELENELDKLNNEFKLL
ncbi:MAG: hypothetical protein ACLFVR_14725 [Thiohalospira sp.]